MPASRLLMCIIIGGVVAGLLLGARVPWRLSLASGLGAFALALAGLALSSLTA